jgi:hypothetical protein
MELSKGIDAPSLGKEGEKELFPITLHKKNMIKHCQIHSS